MPADLTPQVVDFSGEEFLSVDEPGFAACVFHEYEVRRHGFSGNIDESRSPARILPISSRRGYDESFGAA